MIGQAWGACVQDGVATLACICPVYENVVRGLIFFAGIIAVLAILLAGLKYITSGGDSKQVEGARSTLIHAIVGLILILISFGIINLISYITGAEFKLECPLIQSSQQRVARTEPPKSTITPTTLTEAEKWKCEVRPGYYRLDDGSYNSLGVDVCIYYRDIICNNPQEVFYPVNAETSYVPVESLFAVYTDADGIRELLDVFDEVRIIAILAGAEDRQIYSPTGRIREIPIGVLEYYGRFRHGIPQEQLDTAATSWFVATQLIKQGRGTRAGLVGAYISEGYPVTPRLGGFHLTCDDSDYYIIITASPLIYLYPRSETKIAVRVHTPLISREIKVDDLGYWQVLASPDGRLTTVKGDTYRYIPYEFLRSDFKRPEKGFIVEGNQLEEYLRNGFWPKLGLTKQEIEDYWNDTKGRVPKSSYYFVSLIDRSEIDRVLPMEVNPKPDTIIRNMTYILPLSQSPSMSIMPLEEERLKAPKRDGFTVLENGVFVDGF